MVKPQRADLESRTMGLRCLSTHQRESKGRLYLAKLCVQRDARIRAIFDLNMTMDWHRLRPHYSSEFKCVRTIRKELSA